MFQAETWRALPVRTSSRQTGVKASRRQASDGAKERATERWPAPLPLLIIRFLLSGMQSTDAKFIIPNYTTQWPGQEGSIAGFDRKREPWFDFLGCSSRKISQFTTICDEMKICNPLCASCVNSEPTFANVQRCNIPVPDARLHVPKWLETRDPC